MALVNTTSRTLKLLGTVGARLACLALTAATTTLVVRALGPAGTGVYQVLVTIATTAAVFGHLSVEHALVFLWPSVEDRRALVANAVALALLLGTVAATLAWIVVRHLFPTAVPIAGKYGVLVLAVVAVPARLLQLYLNALLALADRIGRANIAAIAGAASSVVLAIVLLATGHLTLTAAVLLWGLGSLVPALVMLGSFNVRPRHASLTLSITTLTLGARYYVGMVALFLLWRVDIFLLNTRVSKAEVGLYALAVSLVELTYVFTDSVAQVVLPRQTEGPVDEAASLTLRVIRVSMLVGTLAVAAISLVAPYIVPLAFGEGFAKAVPPLISLGPGVIALATIRTAGGFLIRLNRPRLVVGATVAALIANISLNLLLIPRWGIVGAGVASSFSYIGLAAFYLAWILRSTGCGRRDLVPRRSDYTTILSAFKRRRNPKASAPMTQCAATS